MKLYRCDFCGRVFHEIKPHVCVHGNYRKRNLTFTAFEDTDCEYVKKSEVDVKEKSFPNIPQGVLLEQKARENEAEVCNSMGAILEGYKNEILDAIGKAKNTEPSRTIHNSGISEDALLKIVAVAQNPELIKDMPYERD